MRARLRALPVVVLLLAAIDTCLVRLAHPYRATEPWLFLEALGLWLAYGCLALLPAGLSQRFLGNRGPLQAPGGVEEGVVLLGWTGLPVLVHALLDRHTALGGDLGALLALEPWLEVGAALLAGVFLLGLLDRYLPRLPAGKLGLAVALPSLAAGLFLPWHPAPSGPATLASPPAGHPNVLLLVWDTTRADRLVPYGADRETTPHLARLAEEATVFETARSVAVFTFTSHVSLLTGALPSEHGGRLLSTRFDPRRATSVASLFHKAGYRTGAFVGTDVLSGKSGLYHDFDVWDDQVDPKVCDTHAWGVLHDLQALTASLVPALRQNGRPHWIQDFQRPASEVLGNALSWIHSEDPRPWFCVVNLYDVHWPYLPSAESRHELVRPYDGPMDGYLFRSDRWRPGYRPTERDQRHLMDLYDAELHDLDAEVDRFLARLDLARGGTALVMTSDHGEAFGEGGEWKHEDVLEPQVRVPLLVRPAGERPAGARVPGPVSGIDVAPTLLGLAGIEAPAGWAGAGLDLTREVPDPERAVWVEDRDHVRPDDLAIALYWRSFKLVRRGLGDAATYTLHDLETDPIGAVDVAAEHPEVFARLRARLDEARVQADRLDATVGEATGAQIDALKALGYAGEQ